jgi:bacteriochlorophyllide a dehydrogenase
MQTTAVIFRKAKEIALETLALDAPTGDDVVVDVQFSGISAGTERLLWSGAMPPFPGMGYPLVPGYESVGTVVEVGATSGRKVGETVFVPGATCFGPVKGLFGGAAQRLVTAGRRTAVIDPALAETGALMALAATAHHALKADGARAPDLIVGHGIVGRLLARISMALGGAPPTVWEKDAARRTGAKTYPVIDGDTDPRRDYYAVYDASGDASLLDPLIGRLARNGEITLAGFYHERPSFAFAPAFMREARLRIAAEWAPRDLAAVTKLIGSGVLSLDDLVTHSLPATLAPVAYEAAFTKPECLKMVLDWRHAS